MRTTLLAAGLFACLAAPLSAQQNPAPGPQSEDAPAPEPPQMDRTRNLAAKLGGLVAFVGEACPDLRGDPAVLGAALRRMGIDPADLDHGDLALVARSYVETYRKDVAENCKRALATFGPSSRLVPGLVVAR